MIIYYLENRIETSTRLILRHFCKPIFFSSIHRLVEHNVVKRLDLFSTESPKYQKIRIRERLAFLFSPLYLLEKLLF